MNSASRTGVRRCAVLVAAVCALASAAYAGAPAPLSNGVPLTGLSGTAGSETLYLISVPASQDLLEITTSGGTGDVDLYVRKDAQPSTSTYDYRGYTTGNDEKVDVNHPAAGNWYVMLRGYGNYAGVTLKATYSAATAVKALVNGVAATGLAGAANAEVYYSIDVPAGQTKLSIAISADTSSTGDADLYVKKDSMPTTTSFDYRPFLSGSNESVSVDNPAAGTWYIMVKGYSAFSGVTLAATYTGPSSSVTVLQNGVAATNLSGSAGTTKMFRFDLPAGQKTVAIKMWGGTGDADMYIKLKDPPTLTDFDYRPYVSGNNETQTVDSPAAGTWFVMIEGYVDYAGVSLQVNWGSATTLQSGVAVTNIAGDVNSETFFSIDVPAGQDTLSFNMSGGAGDADLYIRKGSQPTTTVYDYRPMDTQGDSNESISVSGDNLEGTWYLLVKGVKAYTGVAVKATYAATQTVMPLANGASLPNLSGGAGTQKFFSITVPAGQTKFQILLSGGTGDADLYVKKDGKPSVSDYDYKSAQNGNAESVSIDNPAAGTYYILVRGNQAFAGVSLLATYSGPAPDTITVLQNGVALTGLKDTKDDQTFYKIVVPAGQAKLDIAVSGGTGDVDLYVHRGAKPTLTDWDYRPYLQGNNESVAIDTPAADTWYIMLNAYADYDGVTLKATYTAATVGITALTNGVAVTNLSGDANSEQFYKIDVPAGQDFLTLAISGGTGDCDMYVKKGAKPTVTSWDYRPYLIGNNESVSLTNPAAATWYILLRGYQTYAGLTLKATFGTNTPPPTPGKGNDFASDPNCVALWRFEAAALTADSVGTNTLQNQGATANTTDKEEGTSAAELRATEKDYLWIANTKLSANFPFKSASTPKTISVAFWMKLKSLPPAGVTFDPFSKVNHTTNSNCFTTMIDYAGNVGFYIGTNGGASYEDAWAKTAVVPGQWYHVAITYRDSDRSYRISVWSNDTATSLADVTGVTKSNIAVTGADVYVGQRQGLPANRYFDGLLDEMVVFNDVLAAADINNIRGGTYHGSGTPAPATGNNFAADANCAAVWRFEAANLTADSVGTNTLQNHGVTANTTDMKEGSSAALFTAAEKDYFSIANASLSPKFPLTGATAPKTISVAFWLKLNSLPAPGQTWDPFSKVNDGTLNVFTTMIDYVGDVGFYIGTDGGARYEDAWTTPLILVGKWYHVVVTYKDSDRSYRINIWSADTGTVLVDKTGTLVHNINVGNADVYLGQRQGLPANRYLDGLLDEVAVFNDALAPSDIAKIRAGTYGR